MATKPSVASAGASQSFLELHHWCNSWSLSEGHGKNRRDVSWESDGPEVTIPFVRQFQGELERLGEASEAKRFPKSVNGWYDGCGFRNTRILASGLCYR